MQNSIVKKSLVAGIIVLFIGVGIQPAFANEISINRPSENKEDCGCQVADNFDIVRLERLLDRLKGYTKTLLFLSKNNPKIAGKCQELSDGINKIADKYEELKTVSTKDDYPIICDILEIMAYVAFFVFIMYICFLSFIEGKNLPNILCIILEGIYITIGLVISNIYSNLIKFNCLPFGL